MECSISDLPPFLLTMVYFLPYSNFRSLLWSDLRGFSVLGSKPWVVLGDFNDIDAVSECYGGGPCNVRRINWFNDQIRACGLIDLGFADLKFTWKGPLSPSHLRLASVARIIVCFISRPCGSFMILSMIF
ncbi:hypothetical protein K1719_023484 [Acacia pycnantha]|nr:hypothetical protein K1719_023484 [Acacia pycnantha]